MAKIILEERCKHCHGIITRIAKCSDCDYLKYYSAPDTHYCDKDRAGTVVCKDFKLKHPELFNICDE